MWPRTYFVFKQDGRVEKTQRNANTEHTNNANLSKRKTTLVNTLYEFKTKVSLIVRAVYVQLVTKRKRRRRKAADVLDHDQPS